MQNSVYNSTTQHVYTTIYYYIVMLMHMRENVGKQHELLYSYYVYLYVYLFIFYIFECTSPQVISNLIVYFI